MRLFFAPFVSFSLILMTKMSYADCKEYKIVDHGDRVEAVCVGEPLTTSEMKALETERAMQANEFRYENRADKLERKSDQLDDLTIRKSEVRLTREEIALEREKERLRRDKLNNDIIEERADDMTKQLDKATSGLYKNKVKKKSKKTN